MPTTISRGRPTVALIDLDALRWNFHQIRTKVGPAVRILSMVKANGYGHGAPQIAEALAAEGSDSFGVATVEEGIALRAAGIRAPILVVAGAYPDQLDLFTHNNLTPVVHDAESLARLHDAARKRGATFKIHLKVDTGMGRIGFPPAGLASSLPQLKNLHGLEIEGVFSHFAQADNVAGDYTKNQLEIFADVIERLRAAGITPALVHLANSAATITLPAAHFNMVRPGLMLYGIYPSPAMAAHITLRPVLSWKSRILQLKKVPAGASISYGRTFITRRESLIATIPVGYADGYSRLLSNVGAMLVKGKRAPVAGTVCMDLTMIDVTDIGGVQQGDEVVLLGRQGNAVISADEMAAWSNTISYEILTSIGTRVPRIYYHSKEDN
ncbi:MAG: alanine racemase [Alphaproteobacteria bacterium]